MLRRALAIGLAALATLPAVARAVTVDMSLRAGTDTYQVIPLRTGNPAYVAGSAWNREIALTDGSMLSNNMDPAQPFARSTPGSPTSTHYPALASGQVPSHWTQAADGRVWFTEGVPPNFPSSPMLPPTLDRIGRFDPATGAVVEFGGLTAGANAQALSAGPDGNVWFLEAGTNSVGRITLGGAVTEFPLPAGVTVNVSRGEAITPGPGGDLYFLTTGGVGRITTDGRFIGVITGGLGDFAPNAVAYTRDGNLWTTECGANTLTRISPSGVVTRLPPGTFPAFTCPMGLVAGPDGTPWLYGWNPGELARVLFDTPLVRTDDPTGVRFDGADLNGSAAPRGAATTVHFEYGTTINYGSVTPDHAIGDGDDWVDATARPSGLQPSTTYHYRLIATSVIGTVRGADQTVTTARPPPPPPPPLPVDRDGDGYAQAVDCDDLSAAIHPGARDKPGDRIDQDCSGADAPYERFQPHANAGWKVVNGRIVFTRLTIDEMPAGSSLKLTCTGPGCLLKGYSASIARPVARLDVTKRLKRARLRRGARVELTLSRPGYITTIVRWTIGPPPRVTILCQAPGATKPSAC